MSSIRYSCQILTDVKLSDRFSKDLQMLNLMKIRPVGAELFHADRWADIHSFI